MFSAIMGSPYRFFLAAAVLAAILCLFPARVDAPEQPEVSAQQTQRERLTAVSREEEGQSVGADLSERTDESTLLHRTLYYAPCGHSVQRRDALASKLRGLTREALEKEIGSVIPGAAVTGFSAGEVDISVSMDMPCPLHWVLRGGEDGMLCVFQNLSGEALELLRRTEIPLDLAAEDEQAELLDGRVFDDVQALEGYLESLSS